MEVPYDLPQFPQAICVECMLRALNQNNPLSPKNA
jgi:hypothetical protein